MRRIGGELESAANLLFATFVGASAAVGFVYLANKLADNEPVKVNQLSENRIAIVPPRSLFPSDQRIARVIADVKAKCLPLEDLNIDPTLKLDVLFVETAVANCGIQVDPQKNLGLDGKLNHKNSP